MRTIIHALAGAALLAAASGAAAQVPQAQAPSASPVPTGQALASSSSLPDKLEPADQQLLRSFDAFRRHAIDTAMAAADNDPASVAAARQILVGTPRPIDREATLVGRWRCRSAQFMDGSIQQKHLSGVFSYPYFQCAITRMGDHLFFAKISGSQRESGLLYRVDATRYAFLGGASVNDDPQRAYGDSSDSNVIGWLSQVGAKRLLLQMPNNRYGVLEILELVR